MTGARLNPLRLDPVILGEALNYDPETGSLTWRRRPPRHFASARACSVSNAKFAGTPAGSISEGGYRTVRVNGRQLYAHRIAWALLIQADVPAGFVIDHINGERADNRALNLRIASPKLNAENCRPKSGKLLPRGVFWDRSRERMAVYVVSDRKMHFGGRFDDVDLAEAAAIELRAQLHGGGNAS